MKQDLLLFRVLIHFRPTFWITVIEAYSSELGHCPRRQEGGVSELRMGRVVAVPRVHDEVPQSHIEGRAGASEHQGGVSE